LVIFTGAIDDDAAAAPTVTVVDSDVLPPPPLHARVKVVVAVNVAVVSLPLTGLLPVQPFDAVQLVAFKLDQLNVTGLPVVTDMALGVKTRVGAGVDADTVIVTDCDAVPPEPEQLSAYVPVDVRLLSDCEPDVAMVPLHAFDAVQLVALVLLQVSDVEPPLATLVEAALKVTVGAGFGAAELSL
jgi:hypothetical protein